MKTLPLLAATLLLGVSAQAQAPATPADPAKPADAPKKTMLKFTAPKGAATATRTDGDGGSRGLQDKDKLPALYVLVPNTAALTTKESPALFWYQAAGSNTLFELTVTEPKNPKPVLKLSLQGVNKPGIHRLSLDKQNVALKPGVTYKWTVAWVPKADNRSLNVVAGGSIERVEPKAELTAALADAKGIDAASVYAQNGIWYDALESVSNAIDAAPEDKDLHKLRAELLDQAGLKDAAASERK